MKKYCLYRMYDAGNNLLYIGQSVRLDERIKEHSKQKEWWPPARIDIMKFSDQEALDIAEKESIQIEKPLHNVIYNRQNEWRARFAKKDEHREVLHRYVNQWFEPIDITNILEDFDHYADGLHHAKSYMELRKALVNFRDFLEKRFYWVYESDDSESTIESHLMGIVTSLIIALRHPLHCLQCDGYGYPHMSLPRDINTYRRWSCECGTTAKDNGGEFFGDMIGID